MLIFSVCSCSRSLAYFPRKPATLADAAQIDALYVDLHSHSTASDGAVSPERVMEAAHAAGLGAIALTDHDTVDGIPEAQIAADRFGLRLVAGCELSAYDGDAEIHLLALHVTRPEAIAERLRGFQQERVERAEEMVRLLAKKNVRITFDDVLREAAGGAVGRPHVARAIINGGYVRDSREAFDRYLAFGKPAYVPKPRLAAREAIAVAHLGSALAVWAHPGRSGTRERIRALADDGMDGVEIRHPSHTPEDLQRLARIVDEFGMVPSGGSDWHGATDGYRVLGNMNVPISWLEAQDARLASRVAL